MLAKVDMYIDIHVYSRYSYTDTGETATLPTGAKTAMKMNTGMELFIITCVVFYCEDALLFIHI